MLTTNYSYWDSSWTVTQIILSDQMNISDWFKLVKKTSQINLWSIRDWSEIDQIDLLCPLFNPLFMGHSSISFYFPDSLCLSYSIAGRLFLSEMYSIHESTTVFFPHKDLAKCLS